MLCPWSCENILPLEAILIALWTKREVHQTVQADVVTLELREWIAVEIHVIIM